MLNPLRTALRLDRGEGSKVLHFAGVGLLLQAGLAMGISAADSVFLTYVGATHLPHIYLLTPVMMLAYVPLFSHALRRYGMDRVFDGTLAILGLGGLGFWFAFRQNAIPAIGLCYAAKLYAALWYIGLYNLFWSFIDGYFDLIDAKRLFSFFAAGSAVGAMLGGTLVLHLTEHVGIANLFFGWALLAAACWPLVNRTRRRWRKIETEDLEASDDDAPRFWRTSAAGVRGLLRSPYALLLTAAIFLRLVAATFCDYQAMTVFSSGRDAATLATLFGHLNAAVGVFNLVLTLLVFNPLVNRLGVRNVALIQPLVYGGVFTWLLFDHGFPAAVAGFFAYYGVMAAIEFNNVNLLFAGLPAAARKEIRAFIEGLCEPSASAVAGLFLLGFGALLGPRLLSLTGLGVTAAGLVVTVAVRRGYVSALAANLRRDWLDLSPAAIVATSPEPDEPAPGLATENLVDALAAATGEARVALLETLRQTANASATTGVLKAAGNFTPWERRLAERLIVGFGPDAVPPLVEVARSRRYSLRARSIALRALHKLDYPLLHAVAAVLVDETSLKAYAALGAHVALGESDEPGRATLARIYREYPLLTVEIVLEALTICGRLPPYEAIVMALHSGLAKERGYAIESISQAAGRKLYERLAPWIEERSVEQQIAHGRARGWLPELPADTVLRNALASAFPLESSAAWQALAAENNPAHAPALAAKLETLPHPLLQKTAVAWRRRQTGSDDPTLTPVERVHALMQARAFTGFDFTHLEYLAPHLREEIFPAGRTLVAAGAPCPAAWLVLEGALTARTPDATQTFQRGTVAAAAALHDDAVSHITVTADQPTRVITVPRLAVFACAETFPALGLTLLRRRFVSVENPRQW